MRQSTRSDEFSGSVPFQMGNQNFIPIPIMFPPTWQYPQAGTLNATTSQPPALVPNHNMLMPSATCSARPRTLVESLEIEPWFQALENNPARNRKGVEFTKFGRILAQNGFDRITQLSRDIINIKDLQEWLRIDAGTAAFITSAKLHFCLACLHLLILLQ